jgi:hypothetical protein
MNKITNIEIDSSLLPSSSTTRYIKIIGDSDAVFTLEVKKSDGKYYDFTTDAFTTTQTSRNKLTNVKVGGQYQTNITFPTVSSAETYTITIYALPAFDTEFSDFFPNKIFYQTQVSQVGAGTITFSGGIGTTLSMTGTPELGESTGDVSARHFKNSRNGVKFSTTLSTNGAAADAGFIIADQPSSDDFYWATTETVDGTTSSSTTVVVDDLSNLVEGMDLVYKTGTTPAAANTKIVAIDIDTKTLTLSVANSLTNNDVMTFRAYGPEVIRDAIGIGLEFFNLGIELVQLTNTLRTTISSAGGTSADVYGTSGISKGATIRCKFLALQGVAGTTIGSVTQDDEAGSITISNGAFGVSKAKSKIYIDGSSSSATLTGKVLIDQYPEANQTIYLDLDRILTAGRAS